MKSIFVDTSAWFVYANRLDPLHQRITKLMDAYKGRFVTSNFIFDEIITLCLHRLGFNIAKQVGGVLLSNSQIDLVWVTQEDEKEAWKLWSGRPDKKYSFTDCTSFIVMKRLKIDSALALDEDFSQEGFTIL